MLHVLVRSFNFSNFVNMLQRDRAYPVMTRPSSSLLNSGCLFNKVCGRGSFERKCEGSVRLDGDEGWDWYAWSKMGRSAVELLAKIDGFDTPRTQGWPYWR